MLVIPKYTVVVSPAPGDARLLSLYGEPFSLS